MQPLGEQRRKQSQLESQTGRPLVTPWWEANSGLWAPRLGRPPASGPAIGASRRWPLFGHIIAAAFNRTAVDHFEHECREALLKGYRWGGQVKNIPVGLRAVSSQINRASYYQFEGTIFGQWADSHCHRGNKCHFHTVPQVHQSIHMIKTSIKSVSVDDLGSQKKLKKTCIQSVAEIMSFRVEIW